MIYCRLQCTSVSVLPDSNHWQKSALVKQRRDFSLNEEEEKTFYSMISK